MSDPDSIKSARFCALRLIVVEQSQQMMHHLKYCRVLQNVGIIVMEFKFWEVLDLLFAECI